MEFFVPEPPTPGIDRFGQKFKSWREWNNAKDFLFNIDSGLNLEALFCSKEDPPDVIFEDLRIEVKEIMDKGRKRHDEVKLEIAKYGHTLPFVSNPTGIMIYLNPEDAANLVVSELSSYEASGKYKRITKNEIDILFYVNKKYHWFEEGAVPNSNLLDKFGWRSVSCVIGSSVSIVFCAEKNAPALLRNGVGRYFERN